MSSCAAYSHCSEPAGTVVEMPDNGPLWRLCATESHGPSVVRGHRFYPGLCENFSYFRLPAHQTIRPEVGVAGRCSICGETFAQGIVIRETTWFCCNRHYLQWWRGRNPKLFEKLNRER